MTMQLPKRFTLRRAALLAIAATALCSDLAFAEIKAKLGHAMPDTHPQAAAMNKFAELASSYTSGTVKVQIYHGGVLVSDEKQLQAVQAGTQDLYIGMMAPLSTRVKEVQVWDLPFMFQNEKEVYAVLDGESSKTIFKSIEPSGLVGLTWTGMGFRDLSNSKPAVTKLEAIGANASPMAFAEVFPALEVKALDGL